MGQTNDLERRFHEHNSSQSKSTRSGIPWKIVYIKSFNSRSEAVKMETKIKKMKSRKYIEYLIQSG
ncbi:MAG: GIY-YIG nuclease family protein [Bacteroidota bacterium]